MIFLIFPNQLFKNYKHLKNIKKIYLIEEPRFFTDFKFHKLKIAYHRATMKKYYDMLKKKKYNIIYINYYDVNNNFYKSLDECTYMDTNDKQLNNKLDKLLNKGHKIDTLNFLIKPDEFQDIKKIIFDKRYSHEKFYKYQRVKLDILMDKSSNKPIGNKWSFDKLNRLPLPKNIKVPQIDPITKNKKNKYIIEANKYVEKYFGDNYGSLENFIYPIDFSSTKKWLDNFLKKRLVNFGKYEDAVSENEPFVYHSVLSPMMNIGLITDIEIVNICNKYYLANKKTIPIESYEGFIRQVIGWRNYVYLIYCLEGESMFESNQLNHKNKVDERWWNSVEMLPIDSIINKIVKYAYAHHIERLMYLGNWLLLCNIHPQEVYRIFMEWTIDSYEWVMIPNVFGMSQYATDIMTTRPYFSSSNYIDKMSTFKKNKDSEWSIIWDAVYYAFINKHYKLLKSNYATARQVKHWTDKSDKEQKELIKIAKKYFNLIDIKI
jgi:deoxyribodipyrimidine photolyase-related protein